MSDPTWEGHITNVDEGTFTARLVQTDGTGPELLADFDLALLPDARVGDYIDLYGRPATTLRRRDLPPFTAEGLRQVDARARELVESLARFAD